MNAKEKTNPVTISVFETVKRHVLEDKIIDSHIWVYGPTKTGEYFIDSSIALEGPSDINLYDQDEYKNYEKKTIGGLKQDILNAISGSRCIGGKIRYRVSGKNYNLGHISGVLVFEDENGNIDKKSKETKHTTFRLK